MQHVSARQMTSMFTSSLWKRMRSTFLTCLRMAYWSPSKSFFQRNLSSCVWLFIFALALGSTGVGATTSGLNRTPVHIQRIGEDAAIRIDGEVAESEWSQATSIDDFRLINREVENMRPWELATTVRMFYNDRGLYVSFDMEQPESTFVKIHSAPDGGSLNRDFVTIVLDTSGEGKYGFYFTLFLGGSKRDGVLQPENSWQKSWDGAWTGRTSHRSDGWSAEFFIPWSIVNMPLSDKERTMGLFLSRRIAGVGEYYAWPAIHETESKFLSILKPIVMRDVTPRQQLSFIPFVSTKVDVNRSDIEKNIGADLFWRPSSNFQLTGTVLPDFGTVEADDVIINLTVFETFFPDKRLFFTEGLEVFNLHGGGGLGGTVPFHSRRIGGPPSIPELQSGDQLDYSRLSRGSDLLGAAKGVGQSGKWRYGLLGAWEDDTTIGTTGGIAPYSLNVPGRDFGVVRLVYEDVLPQTLKLGVLTTARWDQISGDDFSYTFDGHYADESGNKSVSAQLFVSDVDGQDLGYGASANFSMKTGPRMSHSFSWKTIDENLNLNALGYNSRNDQTQASYGFNHTNYSPKMQNLRAIGTGIYVAGIWDPEGDQTNSHLSIGRDYSFKNLNRLNVQFSVSPSHLNDSVAYRVEKFRTDLSYDIVGAWVTDNTQQFFYSLDGGFRKEIVEGYFMWGGAGVGYQPVESFRLLFTVSKGFRDGWLRYRGRGSYTRFESWGPRLGLSSEYFVGPLQQVRFDLQWQSLQGKGLEFYTVPNGSTKLVSTGEATSERRDDFAVSQIKLQIRYRWEIAPMSDVFLVYTKTASMRGMTNNSTGETLFDLLRDADNENFAAKFRYRFGS